MDSSMFEDPITSDAYSPEPKPIAKTKAPVQKATIKTTAPKKLTQTTLKKPAAKAAPKKRSKPESDEENSDPEADDSLLSSSPPAAKKQKKAPAPKKSAGRPLEPIDNESHATMADADDDVVKPKPKKASATEQYQKLTQLEHILKRPDTYIGSVERTEQQMWVYNSQTESMESRKVSFVPGLYKIFDEIMVNAADNKQRDKNMDEMRVVVNREQGIISVQNNGRGIPVEMHEKEKIYIPEMIFGHLLTGSNYDDDEQKVVGGRNGYGAKLANIYSTDFTLETQDSKSKQRYKQTWRNNMSSMGKAQITTAKGEDYTKITFKPDFAKFGMDEMDDDFEALAKRRVYDMAGTVKDIKVYLNGERIKIRNFKKYIEMYTKAVQAEKPDAIAGDKEAQVIIFDSPHERWEIGFAVSDGSFQQVSFVNSIATTTGGTHVNHIADQIVDSLAAIVKKKNKGGVALRANQIRNHIFLFVNCLVNNPAFTSQTKEQLTTKPSQFGSKPQVSEKFLKDVAKTEAVQNIIHFAQQKADQMMKKSDGTRRARMNNSKLTDANKAGTRDGHRCTLILTEGDSASLLALAGRAVVDPDLIGVFPLRGKLLNVRDASVDQITKNAEIQNIKKFMGLQHKKVYEDTKSLRYGHLMIMTDQDHDGSHIKGLLINFLEVQFPSLLKLPGFLQEFITPIVKVWKGDPKKPKHARSFFTMPEYEVWKEQPGNQRGWDHKYYKGLGTSAPSDAEIYFRDLDRHLKEFAILRNNNIINESELIDLAFSKKKADARKEWLRQFRPGTYLDMSTAQITYDDFINKELILFSMADNMRSIPSVVDGFKPGQRKVLYTCFRRNLKKDVKVVELAGSVSGLTAYAYGEASLQGTIVGLAQNFVGSNNINCLEPSGNFGSRLQGGSDAASARYIYTRLSPFARKIFSASDEPLLTYNTDDGKTIEPECYCPILPMILVNGADGIGTGWSTAIPNYNPEDIVDNLKARMQADSKDSMKSMKPWFRGWNNEVEDIGEKRFKFSGTIQQTGDNEIEITELPVRMWTQDFKDKLEEIIKAEKIPSIIKDYTEYNTPVRVHFIIKMDGDKQMQLALERGLEETFKLSKTMATSNLVAFDGQGRIHKYETPLDILEEFYQIRLKMYQRRKAYLLNEMQMDLDKLNNQARFVEMIISGKLVVSKKKKAALVTELRDKGFKPIPKIVDAKKQGEFEPVVDENEEETVEDVATGANDYDYLLGMAIWSLTQERIDRLRKQVGDKEVEIDTLIKTTEKQLWAADLDDFINEWRLQNEEDAKRAKELSRMGRRESKKLRIGAKGGNKKRKANRDSDDESDMSDYAAPAKKQNSGKPRAADLFDFGLSKPDTKDKKPISRGAQGLLSTIDQNPVSKPPAVQQGLISDDEAVGVVKANEDEMDVDYRSVPLQAIAKPPAPKRAAKKVIESKSDDEDDEDVWLADAQKKRDEELKAKIAAKKDTAKAVPAPASREASNAPAARTARGAARRPVKYNLDSDDSAASSSDHDFEVGDMVKSYGAPATSKPLFTDRASSTRPGSSHSINKASARANFKFLKEDFADDNDVDSTNYESLMPRGSPAKAAARCARDIVSLSDEDDSLLDLAPKPKTQAKAKVVPSRAVPKVSASASASASSNAASKPAVNKPIAKLVEKPRKDPGGKPSAFALPVAKPLSPAAKAYEKKKKAAAALGRVAPVAAPKLAAAARAKGKKKIESDEEEEDDIVNELLSDDEDVAPVARPSRRAAATKKAKYVVDDDDEEEEEDGAVVEDDEGSEVEEEPSTFVEDDDDFDE